jgi:hypothetical protein
MSGGPRSAADNPKIERRIDDQRQVAGEERPLMGCSVRRRQRAEDLRTGLYEAKNRNASLFLGDEFLCASTLESTRIVPNSSTPEFPNGLANSS